MGEAGAARTGRPAHAARHYDERLGRALAYIDQHLACPISLDELAACASYSAFHFHRVFCQWYGETPQAYIRRYRLQRAASLLRYAGQVSIREIAAQSGFTSAESFVRAFRSYFGMTPSAWRNGAALPGQGAGAPVQPRDLQPVEVQYLPACRIAWQRKLGPYGEDEDLLWQQLRSLLAPYGVPAGVCFGIGLDDPAMTPASRCRFDACISIPADFPLPATVPVKTLAGGLHAVLPCTGPECERGQYWQWLIQHWLAHSRYSVGDQPCFERYRHGFPHEHTRHSELCLPLRRRTHT